MVTHLHATLEFEICACNLHMGSKWPSNVLVCLGISGAALWRHSYADGRGQLSPDAPCKHRSLLTQRLVKKRKGASCPCHQVRGPERKKTLDIFSTARESAPSCQTGARGRGVSSALRPLVNLIGGHFTPGGCRVRFITWTNDHFGSAF
ncbi:hypothetical protein ElyMa_003849700 [Elysia marginata]|uniref:Uncharacterized protein n=1 Tax=Elysia marginata TaxID=1093978 RepID=A0AAV4FHI7_9GAST|nr:hypothetical protein ElyMa_003849700 [Elysia marginata]